jgi:HEAT repeat protein
MSILQSIIAREDLAQALDEALPKLFVERQLYHELRRTVDDGAQRKAFIRVAPHILHLLRFQAEQRARQGRLAREADIRFCFCPVCRGAEIAYHHYRVFLLAARVIHAFLYLQEERYLHANRALLRAARMLNPQVHAALTEGGISVLAPTADLRRTLHAHRDCPALNLIEELWHYYEHGQWLPHSRVARTTCLMVVGRDDGAPAKIAQYQVRESDIVGLTPGYYPHPELLLTACLEKEFAQQLECAYLVCGKPAFPVRWDFEPFRNKGEVWRGSILSGPSAGAAIGVGLRCLTDATLPPPDADYALVGNLNETGHLTSVGGYLPKAETLNDSPYLRIVIPQVDAPALRNAMPDFADRLLPAETLDEAVQHATRTTQELQKHLKAVADDLNNLHWANLTIEKTFVEPRLQVRKPAPQIQRLDAQPSPQRPADERQTIPPRDILEEAQAHLYEQLLLADRYINEPVFWQRFLNLISKPAARAALVGAPGSGKTTATQAYARHLALNALQQMEQGVDLRELTLPLWVRLSTVAFNRRAPVDALLDAAEIPEALRGFYRAQLQAGRVKVFLDGLDEVAEAQENDFKAWLQALLEAVAEVSMVLTCRTLNWESGRRGWAHALQVQEPYELAPLNAREQEAFIRRFFAESPDTASRLLDILRANFALRHAARTYLLATMVALLHRENKINQNTTYADLYELLLLEALRGRWKELRFDWRALPLGVDIESKIGAALRRVLMPIGFQLLRAHGGQNDFTQADWEEAFLRAKEEDAWLDRTPSVDLATALALYDLLIEAGLLVRQGQRFFFAHRSFLEYLAGAYLARQPPEFWEPIMRGAGEGELVVSGEWGSVHRAPRGSWWWFAPEYAEALAFMASAMEDATPLLEAIEAEERKYPREVFRHLLVHRARVVGYGKVRSERREATVQEVVRMYWAGDSPPRDYMLPALRVLGRYAVDALIQRLQDANAWVRREAAWALGQMGDARAVDALIQRLQDENEDSVVRSAAAEALGLIGDVRAVDPLIQRLQDADAEVCAAAAWALGWMGDVRAVDPLIERLQDADAWVRSAAAEALGLIGDVRAVEPLITSLQDANADVRREAAWALGRIGAARAVDPLIQRLQDAVAEVCAAAAWALGRIGDVRAVEPLITSLQDEEWWVRWAAARALGQIGDVRAVEPLITRLQNKSLGVREAAWALGLIRDAHAVEPLITRLQNESVGVREEAWQALYQALYRICARSRDGNRYIVQWSSGWLLRAVRRLVASVCRFLGRC